VFTDSLRSYEWLDPDYVHEAINHAETYVRGKVHTNGLENFWSLLKRMIRGTYVSVAPFHLQAYLDEEAFRFNERLRNDGGRFSPRPIRDRRKTADVEGTDGDTGRRAGTGSRVIIF